MKVKFYRPSFAGTPAVAGEGTIVHWYAMPSTGAFGSSEPRVFAVVVDNEGIFHNISIEHLKITTS